ncbi:MAG: RNA-binding protein [Deltaproteobacteria bacterium]|nr:RNA-binding protein [Deltaproteobacteria bacterium]
MGKKLYIGNLPFDTQEESLRSLFEADGRQVASVQIITDRATGRSRGFGFVELESDEDAQKAIQSLSGKELNGRALVINEAREREPRSGGFDRGGFGGGGNRGRRDRNSR